MDDEQDPAEVRNDLRFQMTLLNGQLKKHGYDFADNIRVFLADTGPAESQIPALRNELRRMRTVMETVKDTVHVPVAPDLGSIHHPHPPIRDPPPSEMLQYNLSAREGDGGARHDVNNLVLELEAKMKSRGGNYMGINGMYLTVVKTLMNHINKLQDRIELLEGQVNGPPSPNK